MEEPRTGAARMTPRPASRVIHPNSRSECGVRKDRTGTEGLGAEHRPRAREQGGAGGAAAAARPHTRGQSECD